jgi:hypothetical protein
MAKKHMKKMLTICSHKGNANQKNTKIPPHPCKNSHHQKHHQQHVLARMWGKGIFVLCWWECMLVQPLWKKIRKLLKNLNMDLPSDPAIPLLEIYPK